MKIHECEQLSPEWFELRRGIPTASAFDKILTGKGKLSTQADDYIYELIGERLIQDADDYVPPRFSNSNMQHGDATEPEARRWYAMVSSSPVRKAGFVTTDCGRFGCSPDALVGEVGGLEIKCPQKKTHLSYWHKGVLPTAYWPQVHGALFVTGLPWWDFVSYYPGLPPFRIRVQPDEYTETLGKTLLEFNQRLEEVLELVKNAA